MNIFYKPALQYVFFFITICILFILSKRKQFQIREQEYFEVVENDNFSCKYCATTTAITITVQV